MKQLEYIMVFLQYLTTIIIYIDSSGPLSCFRDVKEYTINPLELLKDSEGTVFLMWQLISNHFQCDIKMVIIYEFSVFNYHFYSK